MQNEKISPDDIAARSEGLIMTVVDEETILMNPATGRHFGLGKVGSSIWGALEKPQAVKEIAAVLKQQFAVDDQQCEAETIEFLQSLRQTGLITVRNAAANHPEEVL